MNTHVMAGGNLSAKIIGVAAGVGGGGSHVAGPSAEVVHNHFESGKLVLQHFEIGLLHLLRGLCTPAVPDPPCPKTCQVLVQAAKVRKHGVVVFGQARVPSVSV